MKVILAALLSVWASTSAAQGLFLLSSRDDSRDWQAVGRLEIAGSAFCTGALVAPDLVLTAAHCLFDPATGARIDVDDIQFLAGWRNGRASAYRRIRRAVIHPEFDFAGTSGTDRVQKDLALLELQLSIRSSVITPFETDMRPDTGDSVGVVSYAHNRAQAPSLQETCAVLSRQDGILVLSCEVDFGSSGSPVFSFDGDKPRIVSVVSAKAEADGKPVSLAIWLDGPLAALQAELDAGVGMPSGLQRLTVGERRETGAKFVRP